MCTVTLNINEGQLRKVNPSLTDKESITRWVQKLLDSSIACMADEDVDIDTREHSLSPNAHTREEMKSIVESRLNQMESGQAVFIDGEEVFAQLRARYGFER